MSSVNIAIIGTGNMARTMAQTIRKVRHAKLYAVVSRDPERARAFAREFHARRFYGSVGEMVQDRKVQLVYIATPHTEHYQTAKICLLNGKNCLIEKPFTVNAGQAQELLSIAAGNHLLAAEAIWTRYMPFVQTMKQMLDSKLIGEPVQLSASLAYNIRQVPRLTDPALAGGALLDLGVYPLNFASMLFGDDVIRVNASCSYTEKHLDEQDSISLIYRDGKVANLSASMVGVSDNRGEIVGTKGYMVIENINNYRSMTVYDAQGKKIRFVKAPRQFNGYEYELQQVIEALESGQTECAAMPSSEILCMMHMLDFIRGEMGITYPFEKKERPAIPTQAKEERTEPEKEQEDEQSRAVADATEEAFLTHEAQKALENGAGDTAPDEDDPMKGQVISSPDEEIRVDPKEPADGDENP